MRRETRNYIILVVALVIFVVVVVNQFVLSSDGLTEPTTTNQIITPTMAKTSRGLLYQPSPVWGKELAHVKPGLQPLPLQALQTKSALSEQVSRNPFGYYVPPPKPVEPIKPPPLTIDSVNPNSVYAGTKAFVLCLSGRDLVEGAQIFVNGRALATTHVSESALTATVNRGLIAAPGQLRVEAKNASGELFSNPLIVNVMVPPTPPYKYIGRIDNVVFLEKGENNRLEARLGQTVENRWRVTKIAGETVMLEDLAIGIQHTIVMPKPEPRVVSAPLNRSSQRTYPRRARRTPQRVYRQQAAPNQNP